MKQISTTNLLTAGIAVVGLSIAFVLFISLRQAQRARDTATLVDHTQLVLQHVQKTVVAALDNETGARGYVITGRPEFLDPLHASITNFQSELRSLEELIITPLQRQRLDTLKIFAAKRMAFSDSMVQLRQANRADLVANIVSSGRGKAYTDEIRRIGTAMEETARSQLTGRKKLNSNYVSNLNIILYSALAALFLFSFFGIQRIKKEVKLREINEKRFSSLLDAAPDATVIVDNTGVIKLVNRQTEKLFGYQREEMTGKPVEILVPPDKRKAHVQHRDGFLKAAKARLMGTGLELYAVKKDGTSFPVEISLSPIMTNEGMLVSAAVRDITSRKHLETELRKSNAELEAFTYSVSHDLRAPLRGIIGFAAILEEDYTSKLDDEAMRITGIIKSNTEKMGHLIDDLLSFSRMSRQELVKINISMHDLVSQVIEETKPAAELKPVHWYVEKLPDVRADISTIRQVWVNLLSNAVKYSATKEEPQVTIGHYMQGNQRVFFVKDNGVGFDNKYKDKLFRVFQRLHSAEDFEGTGVGLALVEKIISKHGGKVWAEGVVNGGASFYFSLPAE